MAITLNHTIVPAHDEVASAQFFARIFGLKYEGPWAHFAPVRVNESLTMDFDHANTFESHHYAFLISDQEFDAIFARVQEEGVAYGSQPFAMGNGEINRRHDGRGFYFRDPNGHALEVMTRAEDRD